MSANLSLRSGCFCSQAASELSFLLGRQLRKSDERVTGNARNARAKGKPFSVSVSYPTAVSWRTAATKAGLNSARSSKGRSDQGWIGITMPSPRDASVDLKTEDAS